MEMLRISAPQTMRAAVAAQAARLLCCQQMVERTGSHCAPMAAVAAMHGIHSLTVLRIVTAQAAAARVA
jgi:hypothetical protein